jgi:dihydrofolate reductase
MMVTGRHKEGLAGGLSNADLAEGIRELKAEAGKPIVAIGGAGFMRSHIATGLIDEFVLAIHLVVLRAGLPIFNDLAKPLCLKLADIKVSRAEPWQKPIIRRKAYKF